MHKTIKKIIFFLILLCPAISQCLNPRPIVGILTQETSPVIKKHYPNAKSYLSSAYVKSVESSGARVVPILIDQPQSYYEDIVSSINGLVLPGGNTYFNNTHGYAEAAAFMYQKIKTMSDFPVLGICLGLEVLMYLDCGREELIRTPCKSQDQLLNLKFKNRSNSILFSDASDDIIDILENQKTTYNSHIYCITDDTLKKCNIENDWKTITTNLDQNGLEFISSLESNSLPIAGLQFHPEKIFEWKNNKNFPHSRDAIVAMRYFFDWIVERARRNKNHFFSHKTEMESLINNYDKTFTIDNLLYDELYFFNEDGEPTRKKTETKSRTTLLHISTYIFHLTIKRIFVKIFNIFRSLINEIYLNKFN